MTHWSSNGSEVSSAISLVIHVKRDPFGFLFSRSGDMCLTHCLEVFVGILLTP